MNDALQHLSKCDPVMQQLIANYGEVSLENYYIEGESFLFADLASSIAGQQLSIKAASTIWGRVEKLLDGEILPAKFLATTDEAMRQVGLSASKTKYIKCLAQAVQDGTLQLERLKDMGRRRSH